MVTVEQMLFFNYRTLVSERKQADSIQNYTKFRKIVCRVLGDGEEDQKLKQNTGGDADGDGANIVRMGTVLVWVG